jgi:hypothetical protein
MLFSSSIIGGTALPAVLELALPPGAPVKGLVLAALRFGASYFGDDLIPGEATAVAVPFVQCAGWLGQDAKGVSPAQR